MPVIPDPSNDSVNGSPFVLLSELSINSYAKQSE